VIPFTYSMELIAQAAVRLSGRSDRMVVAIDNARGSRWLSLDDGGVSLRIVAEATPGNADAIACRVFLLGEGSSPGGLLVFEGTVQLGAAYPAAPAPQPLSAVGLKPPHIHLPGQLYQHGMFHGPRLQGVTRIDGYGEQGIVADLVTIPVHDYFSGTQAPRFQLDAAMLDAAGQLAGFWLRERNPGVPNCFPFRVKRVSFYTPPPAPGQHYSCHGAITLPGPQLLEARWDVFGADGRLILRAEGWEDRVFSGDERFFGFRLDPAHARLSEQAMAGQLPAELCLRRIEPLPEGTLDEGGTIWKRMLAHMVLGRRERAHFNALPQQGPRREEWLMGRLAAKDAARDWYRLRCNVELSPADVEIDYDPQGRPVVRCAALPQVSAPALSIAHSKRWAYAVASDPSVALGLDYQRADNLRTEDIVAGGFAAAEQVWFQGTDGAERSRIVLALWCAKEAAAKAAGTGLNGRPQDWQVVAAHLDTRLGGPQMARVRYNGQDYDIALHAETGQAMLALCVTAAPRAEQWRTA